MIARTLNYKHNRNLVGVQLKDLSVIKLKSQCDPEILWIFSLLKKHHQLYPICCDFPFQGHFCVENFVLDKEAPNPEPDDLNKPRGGSGTCRPLYSKY
jgi:hypothetical protein